MKTPSFIELKTLVEYLHEQILADEAQLQEITATEEGVVLSIYRFNQNPRHVFLVFDLDKQFPFLGYFEAQPWQKLKKTKPLGLFLNAHAKNFYFNKIEIDAAKGRVVNFELLSTESRCTLEFRLIPKQPNLIIKSYTGQNKVKTISWYPVHDLSVADPQYLVALPDEESRSIPFMMNQWFERRSSKAFKLTPVLAGSSVEANSPYEKWKKQRSKDLDKKVKAIEAIETQIQKHQTEGWNLVGEHLKVYGFKNIKPEWTPFVQFDLSVSKNIQICFEKAKASVHKIKGAQERQLVLLKEIEQLKDFSLESFEKFLKKQGLPKNQAPARQLEGRYRKLSLDAENLTCYMGKSAQDNIDLLRRSKAWDYWMHLKDFPSAHAIIHRQKNQTVSDQVFIKCAQWLAKEGLSHKHNLNGGKFAIVIVECRHVRPIKGDKLGRVTYHEAREILIAL